MNTQLMTGQQLRNSILQEAIQGKLLPTDQPFVSVPNAPFEIPANWEWKRIKEILYPMKSVKPQGQTFLYVDIEALDNKTGDIHPKEIETIKAPSRATRFTKKGDVLFSTVRPYLRNIAIVDNDGYIASSGYYVCSPKECVESKFLYYWLLSGFVINGLNDLATGEHSPSINNKDFENYIIPLPSFEEQKQIVAKVEELFEYIAKYEKAAKQLTQLNKDLFPHLRKSILEEAIRGRLSEQLPEDGDANEYDLPALNLHVTEEPFEIPPTWRWVQLKDIVDINPSVKASDDWDAAFMPMELIAQGYGSAYKYQIKKWGAIRENHSRLMSGDIAFAKITPSFQNRKSFILTEAPNNIAAATTELIVLRLKTSMIFDKYLLYFLKSEYFIGPAEIKGTANQQRVTSRYVKTKLVPIPPLAEQYRIVAKVEEILALIPETK